MVDASSERRTSYPVARHRIRPPGVPGDILLRPRLDAVFEGAFAANRVLAVCAAPGSGKTVQAQLYARGTGLVTAWLTLDASHGSPGRLLVDLAEALAACRSSDADASARTAFRLESTSVEAAAVLAITLRRRPAFLVIDECEHLDDHPESLAVLETFLEYCPEELRILLLSRTDLHGSLQARMLDGRIRLVGESELFLTLGETAELGAVIGGDSRPTEDPARVFDATGGWVAGAALIFSYGFSGQPVSRDLPSMIMHDILAQLPAEEQEFLLNGSVPDVLNRDVAVTLWGPGAHALWEVVRGRHLPATTITDETLHFHALFRTFLHRQLLARDPNRHLELNRVYASYLLEQGRPEQAVEVYLGIDELDDAAAAASRAVLDLCDRSDWGTVLRWTKRLGEARVEADPLLLAARVRSLFGDRRFAETVSLVRRLDRLGSLRVATEADPELLAVAAWALQADPAEAKRLLDRYDGDYRADVVRFMMAVCTELSPATPPLGSDWGDVERIMCWSLLLQGRLMELRAFVPKDPQAAVVNPNVILASVFAGDHTCARDLWRRVPQEIRDRPQSHFIEAILLVGEMEYELALSALQIALSDSRRTAFFLAPAYEVFSGYVLLQLGRIDDAVALLQDSIARNAETGQTALLEWGQSFLGFAYLLQGRHERARGLLMECVRSMARAQRRLFLPFAATCLSEVEARSGDLSAAHAAADLAYRTAAMMGSFATVSPALNAFPDLLVREDEREPGSGLRWRRMVAAPSARPPRTPIVEANVRLGLQPFGPDRDISVNGVPQNIGRMKIVELLAYLALHPGGTERGRLQQVLFPDATLRNGGNHFRQISFKFRQITGLSLDRRDGNLIGLPAGTVVDAADIRFEELLRTVSWGTPADRVTLLRGALDLVPGPYLGGSNLAWAEERRAHLDVVQEEARLELVRVLLELGEPEAARDECRALLKLNHYSDPGYRLLVQIERTIGSESSVFAAYREAVTALEELGLAPGAARELMKAEPPSPRRRSHPHLARPLVRP